MFLCSCAGYQRPRVAENRRNVIAGESYFRIGLGILEKYNKVANPVIDCHLKNFKKAFKVFNRVLNKNIKNMWYWNQVASCYVLDGEFLFGRLYYDTAMNFAKNSYERAVVFNNIGATFHNDGNWVRALEYYKKANDLDSRLRSPQLNMANIYLQFALLEKARKIFDMFYRITPLDEDIINGFANYYLMKGDYQKSIFYFNKINRETRKRRDVSNNFALANHFLGKNKVALDILKDSNSSNNKTLEAKHDQIKDFIEKDIERIEREKRIAEQKRKAAIRAKKEAERKKREQAAKEQKAREQKAKEQKAKEQKAKQAPAKKAPAKKK